MTFHNANSESELTELERDIMKMVYEPYTGTEWLPGYNHEMQAMFETHYHGNVIHGIGGDTSHGPETTPHEFFTEQFVTRNIHRCRAIGVAAGKATSRLYDGDNTSINEASEAGGAIAVATSTTCSNLKIRQEIKNDIYWLLFPLFDALFYKQHHESWSADISMKDDFIKKNLIKIATPLIRRRFIKIVRGIVSQALIAAEEGRKAVARATLALIETELPALFYQDYYTYKTWMLCLAKRELLDSMGAPQRFREVVLYELTKYEAYGAISLEWIKSDELLGEAVEDAVNAVTPEKVATMTAWQMAAKTATAKKQ